MIKLLIGAIAKVNGHILKREMHFAVWVNFEVL